MITMKQQVNFFRKFANEHEQIKDFFFGDIDLFHVKDRKFPCLVVIPRPGVYNDRINTYSYFIGCYDLLKEDHSNLLDVLDETNLILNDLVMYLRQWNSNKIYIGIDDEVNFTPETRVFDSDCAGYSIELDMEIVNDLNCSMIPENNL